MIIGITGGIGSGKSTIAKALAQRGYKVYDCDQEAKRIITENQSVRAAIIDLLGQEAFIGGQYNTAYVAKRVFAQPELLERLNSIVHPQVAADIIRQQPQFVESAILYESGLDRLCEKIIIVDAPEEIRIARTLARDYHHEASVENINKVKARIHAQGNYAADTFLPVLRIQNDGQTPIDEIAEKIAHWM